VLTLPETVLFDYNSATLRSESSATITKVASVLNYFSTAQIGVQGHTDSTGAADKNQTLSEQRAQSVADALSKGGVTSSRMTVKGFGANNPIASNGDDAGRQKNRRVEIVLVQK
jgi:outer membrane protein OmpA-like peptidoglycan-associated protein